MVHLWGFRAEFAHVVNRTGCPWAPWGPFSPRPMISTREHRAVQSHSQAAGARPGVRSTRPTPPHTAAGRGLNRFDGLHKGAGPRSCEPPSAPSSIGHTAQRSDQTHHNTMRPSVKGFGQTGRVGARPPGGRWHRAPRKRVAARGCPPASCRRAEPQGRAAAHFAPAALGAGR
jgi:hypothetical protein